MRPDPPRPTLVLLPGLDGTGALLGEIRSLLAERFPVQVVAYPPDRVVPRAELLETVAAALPPDGDHVLVAESFSGPLAIELATSRPAHLRALVLVASFATCPLPRGLGRLRHLVRLAPTRLPAALVRLLLVGRDAPPELVAEVRAAVASVAPEVLRDRLRQVLEVDVRDGLAALDVPLLDLAAGADRLLPRRSLDLYGERGAPRHRVTVDGPHLLLQRRPRECAAAIARFLDALPPSGARQGSPSTP